MSKKSGTASRGLEGVVAAASAVSSIIDSRLTYRGIDIDDLAEHSSFEETVYLLWTGRLPTRSQLEEFRRQLAEVRALPAEIVDEIRRLPLGGTTMDALRTAVSALGMLDSQPDASGGNAAWNQGIRLVAQLPAIVAAVHRIGRGQEVIAPEPTLSLAANFLYMVSGQKPAPRDARILDQALVLHADHELNASTFAARVVASTLAGVHAAVIAALCALSGSLHGGANEAVMRMLEEIGEAKRVSDWLDAALGRRDRIMGFGHRVYRQGDPRARLLKRLSSELAQSRGDSRWYDISARLEEEVVRTTGLQPNVDFYSASVYTYLGVPRSLFTPVFAMSRVAGWIAHIREQYQDNRLIRPRAEYIGPGRRPYIGMEHR